MSAPKVVRVPDLQNKLRLDLLIMLLERHPEAPAKSVLSMFQELSLSVDTAIDKMREKKSHA